MMDPRSRPAALPLLGIALALAACSTDSASPTPTPEATATPEATPSPQPTALPTDTPNSTPTQTDAATATPGTPTPEATPAAFTTLSGMAYQFATKELLPGAAISLDEYPEIQAVSDENGEFTLENVPVGAWVTPRIEARGYQPMWQHTFFTTAEPIDNIFFQTVSMPVFNAFAAILEIEVDPELCQIVTTVTQPEMNDVHTWDAFFSPHGLAGVTAVLDPEVPPEHGAIYFTEETVPNWSLTESTDDGGILWVNVPPMEAGRYELVPTDLDGSHTFEPTYVTCKAGRFINACPPWGIRSHLVE